MYYYFTKDFIFQSNESGEMMNGGVKLKAALIFYNHNGTQGNQAFEYGKHYEVYIKEPYTCIIK